MPGLLSCSAAVADTSWRIIHAAAANSSVIDRFFAPVSRSDRRTPRTWSEMTTIVELRGSRRSTARTRPKASWRKCASRAVWSRRSCSKEATQLSSLLIFSTSNGSLAAPTA